MITLTREELIDEVSDALSDAADMDTPWSRYAEAAVDRLIALGMVPIQETDRLCMFCGKPGALTPPCGMGGAHTPPEPPCQ